jgi:sec-independent protein translocase protein TatC
MSEASDGLARMTLVEHLAELRTRLIRSAIALAVGATIGFIVANRVLEFLVDPYCKAKKGVDCGLVVIDPLEGFTTRVKIALFVGGVIAAPVILWQLWRFITPALHKNEKRYAIPFVASSMLLFTGGAVLAVLTFPKALDFLISIGGPSLVPLFSPSKYLALYMKVVLAFGISFEFPILLIFLQVARIVTPQQLSRARRGFVVGIVVFAAVITPSQDPITLMTMAVPMYVLFEAAILIGKALRR